MSFAGKSQCVNARHDQVFFYALLPRLHARPEAGNGLPKLMTYLRPRCPRLHFPERTLHCRASVIG